MNDNPKFSIIIPLYNKSEQILRCVNSIFNQNYHNYEVIVVDDGSDDNGGDLVRKLKNSKIKVYHQENQGVSIARNNGIKLASGDYIAFLDADDEFKKGYLEEILYLIRQFPDCGIYATSMEYSESTTNYMELNKVDLYDYFRLYTEGGPPAFTSSIVVKNDGKINNLFPENVKMGEDLYAWVKILNNNEKFAFSPKRLAIYHCDDDNSAMATTKARKLPILLSNKGIGLNIKSSYYQSFLAHLEDQYIKSNILYGKRLAVLKYIVYGGKLKLLKFLPLLLIPKKMFTLKNRFDVR